jgi:peptidoglycan/LPS O-acetylase OafA/YrhL
MRANRNAPIGVDLFAGAGGMSLSFEQAGFDVAASVSLWPYISFFVGGVTAGFVHRTCSLKYILMPFRWDGIGLACVATISFGFFLIPLHPLIDTALWHKYNWIVSPWMAVTVLSIASSEGATQWLFANAAARFVGRISYSLYLVNTLILHSLREFNVARPLVGFIPVAMVTVVVAWLLYLCIEEPGNRLGRRLATRIMG